MPQGPESLSEDHVQKTFSFTFLLHVLFKLRYTRRIENLFLLEDTLSLIFSINFPQHFMKIIQTAIDFDSERLPVAQR